MISPLRPSGTAEFGGAVVDVIAQAEFIENGAEEIMVDKFNIKPGIWDILEKAFPDHMTLIKDPIFFRQILYYTTKICEKQNVSAVSAFQLSSISLKQ